MEEVLPMELVKNNFNTELNKLSLIGKREFVCFYQATTSYGKMTLIVEQFYSESTNEKEPKTNNQQTIKNIEQRNNLLKKQEILCPLIYEQEIKRIRENYFVCLTLTEPIEFKTTKELLHSRSINVFENLVEGTYRISLTQFQYELHCYQLEIILASYYTDHLYLDFTRIVKKNSKGPELSTQNFKLFKKQLCQMISTPRPGKIPQIIFIKEKSVLFNSEEISKTKNWTDLALMFNLLPEEKVHVLSEKKPKTSPINRLQGHVTFQYKNQKYENLNFDDGYRTDGFRELTYQQLRAHFFQQKLTYFMSKGRYHTVHKRYTSEQILIKNEIQFSDLIIVKEQISKAQFISFLIGYLRYIQPIIHIVKYIHQENALLIEYLNKANKIKSVLMKFSPKYVVKDEEITMIIEKGKLKFTTVSLEKMQITDSCLMFLANSDKMLNISSLDISYCPHISEMGIQMLFSSPMCKNVKTLKMSGLTLPDFLTVKFKTNLKQLQINNCKSDGGELNISDWGVQRMQAEGVKINLHFPDTLKMLTIGSQVLLQSLKLFQRLGLTHLKVKLVQNKKNITNFLNNFYIKENPVKAFAQGRSKFTLKHLDISQSTVKLKQLKPIFMIQTLQNLVCEGIEKDKFGDCSLPQNIASVSLKNSQINFEQITELLSKMGIIIKLNVCRTNVDEDSLFSFISSKKYINFLEFQEEQLSLRMLQKNSGVQTIHLHLFKLIRDQHQLLLNKLLLTQAETNKEVNFICQEKLQHKLISKIHRFSMFYESHLNKMLSTNLNIYINQVPIWKLIHLEFKGQNYNQHINVICEHSHRHKVKLYPAALLSEVALQGIEMHMEAFNVFLHKAISLYPNQLLQISIRSNRVLNKQVIQMIRKYAGDRVRSIDFRDCIFGFSDVKNELYKIPFLECVNEGQYEISLTEQDNCEQELQKILKFFMKLKQNQKIKLTLKAHDIFERQLYYSIIHEMLHQYSPHIISLIIEFKNMKADKSQEFWNEVFSLYNLEIFKITYNNDNITQNQIQILSHSFQSINNFAHLYSLDISFNFANIITEQLNFKQIKRLHIDLTGETINQNTLSRLLKNLTSLTHLDVKVAHCQSLTSLKKMSDALQKMTQLAHLTLNIENCPLKQPQIFQFVYFLHKNKCLQRLQLNINNIQVSISDLIRFCQLLQKHNKYCHILIYALQAKKQNLNQNQNELLSRGIEVIHSDMV